MLARQLKESSLMMNQSLNDTEKVVTALVLLTFFFEMNAMHYHNHQPLYLSWFQALKRLVFNSIDLASQILCLSIYVKGEIKSMHIKRRELGSQLCFVFSFSF